MDSGMYSGMGRALAFLFLLAILVGIFLGQLIQFIARHLSIEWT